VAPQAFAVEATSKASVQSLQVMPKDLSVGFSYIRNTNLKFGMKNNPDVKAMQQALTFQGLYKGKIDGNFNSLTRESVKTFQKKNKLVVNGIVEAKTRTVLNKIYVVNKIKNQQSQQQIISPLSSAKNSSNGSTVRQVSKVFQNFKCSLAKIEKYIIVSGKVSLLEKVNPMR